MAGGSLSLAPTPTLALAPALVGVAVGRLGDGVNRRQGRHPTGDIGVKRNVPSHRERGDSRLGRLGSKSRCGLGDQLDL